MHLTEILRNQNINKQWSEPLIFWMNCSLKFYIWFDLIFQKDSFPFLNFPANLESFWMHKLFLASSTSNFEIISSFWLLPNQQDLVLNNMEPSALKFYLHIRKSQVMLLKFQHIFFHQWKLTCQSQQRDKIMKNESCGENEMDIQNWTEN